MKYAVALVLAVGLAQGAVLPAVRVEATDRFHTQDEFGQYSYGYVDGASTKTEIKTADGVTRGGYSYVDPNGLVQSTSYVADSVNGFRVAATNLPVGHPVAYAGPYYAAGPVVAPHFYAAPAVVSPHFVGAPAVVAPAPAAPEAAQNQPAPAAAAPEASAPAPVAPEAAQNEAAPAAAAAPASGPAADDTVAVEAAGVKSTVEESAPAAPQQDAPAPVAPQQDAQALPGPAPEPVQDTPEVAQARLQHLAAVEDTKARNALYENANRIVGETYVQAPIFHGAPLVHAGPAVLAAPAVTRTVVSAPAPVVHAGPVYSVAPLAVSSQYHSQDELGQYSFGYIGGPSSKHEVKTADGITSGGYSYLDANGLVQSTSYVSDPVNGFRVSATNLPVQPVPQYLADTPEVAQAKENLFRAQAEHISKL